MILHPAIARAKIDTCYLDTTYLNPKYCFPPQPQVIEACALLARKVCVGISHTAPPLDDIKGSVKAENADKFDVKPDINAVREEAEGKSKALMTTWLVKRESEDGVKMESEPDVKMEPGMEVDQHQPEVKRDVGDVLRDVKPDTKRDIKVKPTARTLVVMGTYSIGKERIVKGECILGRIAVAERDCSCGKGVRIKDLL
jgi:DNA cross-link repair 1A protein